MKKSLKTTNLIICNCIIWILPLFFLQSCDIATTHDASVCSHPFVVLYFDAEIIGTTTGEVETWNYERRYPDFIHTSITFPLGIDTLDSIAKKYEIFKMVQMYKSNLNSMLLYDSLGVYPLNVFLVEVNFRLLDDFVNDIANEESILYYRKIECTNFYCRDALWKYKPKP